MIRAIARYFSAQDRGQGGVVPSTREQETGWSWEKESGILPAPVLCTQAAAATAPAVTAWPWLLQLRNELAAG